MNAETIAQEAQNKYAFIAVGVRDAIQVRLSQTYFLIAVERPDKKPEEILKMATQEIRAAILAHSPQVKFLPYPHIWAIAALDQLSLTHLQSIRPQVTTNN